MPSCGPSEQVDQECPRQQMRERMNGKEIWALYLPQFYETKENNEWWGEGFTEWTNVKKARPLFPGHVQPLVPKDEYYYDLTDVSVMTWQAQLARKYSVSCFVVYHYWYEGRLLLNLPIENLLKHPEIDFQFCFCWANHSWTRAWDGKNHEILVEQTYGGIEEWEEHLQYLLPFFRDKRYRKINNMPVLFVYNASTLQDGNRRIEYYSRRLKEEGFDGIYIIEYISTFNPRPSLKDSQGVFEDEPNFSDRFKISPPMKAMRLFHKMTKTMDVQSFDVLWKHILSNSDTYGNRSIFRGAFGIWDNSPRKGRNSRVIVGATPGKLRQNLSRLISSSNRDDDSGIVVFNAWNEWGEGATLEPTENYANGFLEAIRDALLTNHC